MALRRARRVEWLVSNTSHWIGVDVPDTDTRKSIIGYMKREGLVAKTTYWKDVHIAEDIQKARRIIQEKHR